MAEQKIVEAAESFSVYLKAGTPFIVVAGERFYDDDPIVQDREHLFRELTVRSSKPSRPPTTRATETAAAAPGTQRATTRPAAPSGKDGAKP